MEWNEECYKRLARLWAEGIPPTEIAQSFGNGVVGAEEIRRKAIERNLGEHPNHGNMPCYSSRGSRTGWERREAESNGLLNNPNRDIIGTRD